MSGGGVSFHLCAALRQDQRFTDGLEHAVRRENEKQVAGEEQHAHRLVVMDIGDHIQEPRRKSPATDVSGHGPFQWLTADTRRRIRRTIDPDYVQLSIAIA